MLNQFDFLKSLPMSYNFSFKVLTFFLVFIVSYFLLNLVKKILFSLYQSRFLEKKRAQLEIVLKVLENIKGYFLISVALYFGTIYANFSVQIDKMILKMFTIIFFIQALQILNTVINHLLRNYVKKRSDQDPEFASTVGLMGIGLKFLVFSFVVLLALNNVGVDVTSLIAGLGVGGVAAALALQNILSDLFSSLTIIMDKPFIVGDFIMVNELLGTVEHIGIKTTRVRSLSGEELIFGNSDLLQSRIKNYKRMKERRVVQKLTVIYQTKIDMLEQIPGFLKNIVEEHEKVKFDRCHLLRFLDSALEFELVYWVLDPDYDVYADISQSINFKIIRKFTEHGVEFAYPTQTLFLTK